MTRTSVSAAEARRISLAAQGLGARPEGKVSHKHVLDMVNRLGVVQIDSVNVLARAHYLPAFSRLGNYTRNILEDSAWSTNPTLLEYWAHEASFVPMQTQPLLRWRMADARQGIGVWKNVARFLQDRQDLIQAALAQIRDRGPLAASDLDFGNKGTGGWWGWSEAKRAVECLFWCGELTGVTRRASFERVYGLTQLVLPPHIASAPTPSRQAAQRQLVTIAASAMGIATERDLRDYFRLGLMETRSAIQELVEEKALLQVTVEGWQHPGFLHSAAKLPARIASHALLSPFDNAIWFRDRTERLFDVRVKLEIYTPAAQRLHGYYVLPFLEGDRITARLDLKADRKTRTLIVQSSHRETDTTAETPARLAQELWLLAQWLGLDQIKVMRRGRLAPALAACVKSAA
jgi:uncharacterized protein